MQQILKSSLLNSITHRNEEKRKIGRVQLQKLIYIEAQTTSDKNIQIIVDFFKVKYIKSSDITRKTVGLQVMVTILNAIQHNSQVQIKFQCLILANILDCLIDNEAKIRALTFEKIFEIMQMFKNDFMRFFNPIYEKIIGCINDTEQTVKNSCEFVQRKMRDIFHQNYNKDFNIDQFAAIIKAKIKTPNIQVKRFLIGWINQLLDLDLVVYVGQFLEDLLVMSSNNQIENTVYECISNFEMVIKQKFYNYSLERQVSINFIDQLVSDLIKVANSKCPSKTKLETLKWFKLFFVFFSHQIEVEKERPGHKHYFKKIIIQRFDQILEPILVLMSHQEEQIRRQSVFVNQILKDAIERAGEEQPVHIIRIVPLLKQALSQKKASNTSEYALNWMKFMLEYYKGKMLPGMTEIVSQVMQKIYQGSAKNIYEIIQIMKSKQECFSIMIEKMLQFLNKKIWQQQERTQLMIRKFIIHPKDITLLWTSLCRHIDSYLDQPLFMYEIAAALNSIIINESNMKQVRYFLTNWSDPNYVQDFQRMFKVLKYNPPAAISLCFLSNQYELAFRIIDTLTGKRQISPKMLIGLCKLVSQLQTPAFVALRMQILEQDNYYLMQSLNSLLMLLPQGKIFNMLRRRLDSGGIIPKEHKIHLSLRPTVINPVNIDELFEGYKPVYGLK